jgi:hypothetical protein
MFDTELRAAPSTRSKLARLWTQLADLLGISIWVFLGAVLVAAVMNHFGRLFAPRAERSAGSLDAAKLTKGTLT